MHRIEYHRRSPNFASGGKTTASSANSDVVIDALALANPSENFLLDS